MSSPPKDNSNETTKAPKPPRTLTAPNNQDSPMYAWATAVESVVRQEVRAGNLDLARTDFDARVNRIIDAHMHLTPSTLPAGVTTAQFRETLYIQTTDIFARALFDTTYANIDNARRASVRSGVSQGFVQALEDGRKKVEELLAFAQKKGTFSAKNIEKLGRLLVTAEEQLKDLAEKDNGKQK